MDNKRRLLRLEVDDFLEVKPLQEVARQVKGYSKNFSLMGICFSSEVEWKKGQLLLIDYFIPEEFDSVKLKVVVVWSELIDDNQGYFCGGEIVSIEKDKEDKFANYYYQKLKDRFLR
jgi:hypothetical protein